MAAKKNGDTEQASSTNNSKSSSSEKIKVATAMKDQLNRSREQIYQNKLSTRVLHRQWKRHLLNLSYLLIVLSFMQLKGPALTCLQDIKAYNNNNNNNNNNQNSNNSGGSLLLISGIDTIQIVVMDSIVPTIAIVMAAALSFFLIQTANITTYDARGRSQFSNPSYILACACIPIILLLSQLVQAKGDKEGCIDDLLQEAGIFPSHVEMQQRPSRGFPVVLVFHVIVTICFGFMESQMQIHERGLVQIDKLLQELHDSSIAGGSSSSNDSKKSKTTSESKKSK